jgi:hypothetical protein
MNVSVGEIQKASCQFCNKKGLPVLPLRYALARQGMGGAPSVASPFVVAEKEQRKEQFSLPKDLADYTLRILREGYLYVYDEFRKEWAAYVVTQGGYLFEFDPDALRTGRTISLIVFLFLIGYGVWYIVSLRRPPDEETQAA